jgi:hypothetical protein
MRLRVIAEITLGFILFTIGLLVIGSLSLYNLTGLLILLGVLSLFGYTWHKETYHDIQKRSIDLENHDFSWGIVKSLNLKLLSIEFWFFFLTFLLAISLINVIRPMPIGWDDLWVYMNFPKIMAISGHLLEGAGMYTWQLITGTGFLFSYNASQAFYLNQLGGILSVIAIISTLSYAFEKKEKSALLSLPILFATVYYAMPMTVFQQAKDMKVDPAYLFFSITGIMLLFHVWKWGIYKDNKKDLILLAIIGVIIGFTFTVKVTSVMLILACLGVIAYRLLSFSGYIGFFFIFLAAFTKMNLWGVMNVPMPKDPSLIANISIFLWIFGIFFIAYSLYSLKRKEIKIDTFSSWIFSSIVFGIGVIVGCAPWLIKNAYEVISSKSTPTLMSILGGSWGVWMYDYKSLFTEKELEERKSTEIEGMTKDGKSENEDFGRYFWYEWGLNNYLKLPANLTFQKNQWGEFTDITYIFLALLPGLLLFIRWRMRYSIWLPIWWFLIFLFLYYFRDASWVYISSFFSQFSLIMEYWDWKSYGYGVILLLNLLILGYFHFATKDTHTNRHLREVIIFMGIYAFLFMIAAFGIVWYGIVIYFGFFLIMGYSALTFLTDTDEKLSEEKESINLTLASILFIFIIVYFIRSAFPHGWNNLKSAYYNEYKYNTLSQEESIFAYRSDYLTPIATMNLKDISKIYDGIEGKMQSKQMKEIFASTDIKALPLDTAHSSIIMKYRNSTNALFKNDIRILGQHIYSQILYPPKENMNMGWIYRIGTFMTYLINENRRRYFDDSLVITFGDYFYDPSPEKTIERMKTLGLKYLLVDLNAATIDKDPRHALTDRAEKLLVTMNASNLKLISTDNFCLEMAISERKKWKLETNEKFIDVAGTNYESYRSGVTINRNQKLSNCHRYMISVINEKRAAEYPTIEALQNEIITSKIAQNPEQLRAVMAKYAGQSWFALFEIIDTPPTPQIIVLSGVTLSWAISR